MRVPVGIYGTATSLQTGRGCLLDPPDVACRRVKSLDKVMTLKLFRVVARRAVVWSGGNR